MIVLGADSVVCEVEVEDPTAQAATPAPAAPPMSAPTASAATTGRPAVRRGEVLAAGTSPCSAAAEAVSSGCLRDDGGLVATG